MAYLSDNATERHYYTTAVQKLCWPNLQWHHLEYAKDMEVNSTLSRVQPNVSNEFLDLESISTEEIVKIHDTVIRNTWVPLELKVDLDFQGHPNMLAQ